MPLDPNLLIIGFDAEWVHQPETDTNHILSYQYFGKTSEGTWSGIIYTKGSSQRDRLTLAKFVGAAIEAGRKAKILGHKWPTKVYMSAHFSRADLSAFSDFKHLKDQFDSVRKTYTTITLPHNVRFNDKSNNKHDFTVWLIDTMLISPNGSSLASLGELYDLQKIELPTGTIEHMDHLLESDPDLFEEYAIRDAEISAEHAWRMVEFVSEHMGGNSPPVTLGSLAVKHLLAIWKEEEIQIDEVLGNEKKTDRQWVPRKQRYHTKTVTIPIDRVNDHMTAASESYHGGRNEAYVFGFAQSEQGWQDVDLAGAYTTAMAAIRIPDWSNLRVVSEVDSFKADELGSAQVRFKFPEDTRFPCLPVRYDNGLIFPLEGKSYAGSPEIVLAKEMGAELEIIEGYVVPWASDIRPFEVFSSSIHTKRQQYEKGTLEERTWKEIGNSLYGKLAQGVQKKRVFDSREGGSSELPPSKVSQPFLASYTTSLVRAVLGELLYKIPPDKEVVSATTDGFISNVWIDELDLTGPLCCLFSGLRERIAGDPNILEVKNFGGTVLCWKTRGQAEATPEAETTNIIAKAGIKAPTDLENPVFDEDDYDPFLRLEEEEGITGEYADLYAENAGPEFWQFPATESYKTSEWVVQLFLDRQPDQKIQSRQLISMRQMFDADADMISIEGEQRLNMEYDWKRELVDPFEQTVWAIGGLKTHLFARSRPWKSLDEFTRVRELFDNWRIKEKGVLKTMADWKSWQEYQQTAAASKRGIPRSKGGLIDQVRKNFIQAYATSSWGLPGSDYKGIAAFLTDQGYVTSENDMKNAKRKRAALAEQAFERTDEVLKFINTILGRYPKFDWKKMVVEEATD